MKIQIYKSLFKWVSFLTNKTNGNPLLVKYKLILGTLLMSTIHASSQNIKHTEITQPTPEIEWITCYRPDVSRIPIRVKAKVINEKDTTLSSINVCVKKSDIKTLTDENGEFDLELTRRDTLTFISLGYKTREIGVIEILQNNVIVMTSESKNP